MFICKSKHYMWCFTRTLSPNWNLLNIEMLFWVVVRISSCSVDGSLQHYSWFPLCSPGCSSKITKTSLCLYTSKFLQPINFLFHYSSFVGHRCLKPLAATEVTWITVLTFWLWLWFFLQTWVKQWVSFWLVKSMLLNCSLKEIINHRPQMPSGKAPVCWL